MEQQIGITTLMKKNGTGGHFQLQNAFISPFTAAKINNKQKFLCKSMERRKKQITN